MPEDRDNFGIGNDRKDDQQGPRRKSLFGKDKNQGYGYVTFERNLSAISPETSIDDPNHSGGGV